MTAGPDWPQTGPVRARSNLLLAKTLWTAAADGDADVMRELFDENIVWHAGGTHPLSGDRHGPDQVLEYLAGLGEWADDLKTELEEIYAGDAGAIVRYRLRGCRGERTIDTRYYLELEVEESLVVRARTTALDQAAADRFWA